MTINKFKLVEHYAKEQGLWVNEGDADPTFTHVIEFNMRK